MNTLMTLLPAGEWLHALGWSLIHFIWQGAAVAAVYALGLWLWRPRSAGTRYWTGCLALCLMVLAPLWTFCHLAHGLKTPEPLLIQQMASDGKAPGPSPGIPSQNLESGVSRVLTPMPDPPALDRIRLSLDALMPWLVWGWAFGVAALTLRWLAGWFALENLKHKSNPLIEPEWAEKIVVLKARLAITRPVRLLQSACVEVPIVAGLIKPVILVPAAALCGLSSLQLELLIAHELAHIHRHDYLVNLMQSVVETLLFYHPAVWWISSHIRQEREHCCDDLAIAQGGNRLEYVKALAQMETLRTPRLAPALGAQDGSLLQRVRRLAGQPEPLPRHAAGWWMIALIATALGLGAYLGKSQANTIAAHAPALARNTMPGPSDEAIRLLQGVEKARSQIPPSRLIIRASLRPTSVSSSANVHDLKIEFDGSHRKFTSPGGYGPRLITEGNVVISFDGESSTTIRDLAGDTPDYNFDPRVLGLTSIYTPLETLAGVMGYNRALKIEMLGDEKLGNSTARHVRVFHRYDYQTDIWIDAQNGFRVYRYDCSVTNSTHSSTLAYYADESYPWLPSRVETKSFDQHGELRYEYSLIRLQAEANVIFPGSTWTLAGLEMPLGVSVTDLRAKTITMLGYWDGSGLADAIDRKWLSSVETTSPRFQVRPVYFYGQAENTTNGVSPSPGLANSSVLFPPPGSGFCDLFEDPANTNSRQVCLLYRQVLLDESMIASATAGLNLQQKPEVTVTLTPEGALALAKATEANINNRLAFLFDGKLLTVPKVMGKIAQGKIGLPADSLEQAQATVQAIELAARQKRP